MTMLVLVTFDIKDASSADYEEITEGLADIGLEKDIAGKNGGKTKLPYNTYAGKFPNTDSVDLREELEGQIKAILKRRNKKGRIFIVVSSTSWTWAERTV